MVRGPGFEPGPAPWQGAILPLDDPRFFVLMVSGMGFEVFDYELRQSFLIH